MSKDAAINISKTLHINEEYEDVYMSKLLCNLRYSLTDVNSISRYSYQHLIDDTLNIPNDFENILFLE
jgi:hypothetical protein